MISDRGMGVGGQGQVGTGTGTGRDRVVWLGQGRDRLNGMGRDVSTAIPANAMAIHISLRWRGSAVSQSPNKRMHAIR